jgi:DNA invertase Pin-like site-specific DNA recombinase
MADAHRHLFDAVIVWKFDRFARSVSHLLRALETFQELGIDFVSLSESLDTSTPVGKMVLTVLGAVAELERSLIVERVKAGLRNARAKGKRLGRPRVILDVYCISQLRMAGRSRPQIANQLGYGVGTVYRAFHNVSKKPKDENLSSTIVPQMQFSSRYLENFAFPKTILPPSSGFSKFLSVRRCDARFSKNK